MPKHFTINRRPLSLEEKYKEALFHYIYDLFGDSSFEFEYLPVDDGLNDEQRIEHDKAWNIAIDNDDFDEMDRLSALHPYVEPILDIDKTLNKLDADTRDAVISFAGNDMFKETISLKCLKCHHEQIAPWNIVNECWNRLDFPDYPISYCPICDKPKFVPLDIYNKHFNK